jgi:bifunctional NMN adenylyltransferase/nudix hydrolase
MENKYDYSVYIGRFQPPHRGHIESMRQALEISDKLIILIGSANASRDLRNPFTDADRERMIIDSLKEYEVDVSRVHIEYVQDRYYQNKHWITDVQKIVQNRMSRDGWKDLYKVTLIGYEKDDSSWYLNAFPHWDFTEIDAYTHVEGLKNTLNSTQIRDLFYRHQLPYIENVVTNSTFEYLKEMMNDPIFEWLRSEYEFALKYERQFNIPEQWSMNAYTADAVVIQSGHILLVQRRDPPGAGLWALPGGHVGRNETSEQAAIRELREETKIDVPEKVLRGSIKGSRLFEHPERSMRARIPNILGRTITMAYAVVLNDANPLPRVKGESDAFKAWWFPLSEFASMRNVMFEDHYDIAYYFIDQLD